MKVPSRARVGNFVYAKTPKMHPCLAVSCPLCAAKSKRPCRITVGIKKGELASQPHKERIEAFKNG